MNILADVLTYVRRLIKSPSNSSISNALIIDYVNRFWLLDMDARIQLFDFKTTYKFQTIPGVDKYTMPLYNIQTEAGGQQISYYPIYQGFEGPCYVNGIQVPYYAQRDAFFNIWPNYTQWNVGVAQGNGSAGPYTVSFPYFPAIPGVVDMQGIIKSGFAPSSPLFLSSAQAQAAIPRIPTTSFQPETYITATGVSGNNVQVCDSGIFLSGNTGSKLYGIMMTPGDAPYGNTPLAGGYSTTMNTVDYQLGTATVTFSEAIPSGNEINVQCLFYEQGLPRAVLFYNNVLTFRNPPDQQYQVAIEAYLSPAAFLQSSEAVPFAYMTEYIARGAARKILADTGDMEQFNFYEPLFIEQEHLVWKRSQRQFTSQRTQTIFSQGGIPGTMGNNMGTGGGT